MKTVEKEFITKSFEETQKIAASIAKNLKGGEILALEGDLGSGKTTFVQGMAKSLGIKRRLISPTFNIIRMYELKIKNQKSKVKNTSKNSKFFYHIDLYRLESEKDIESLGIKEVINNPENIVVIEWAERMGSLLPEKRINIKFEHLEGDKRRIVINKFEARNPKSETNLNDKNSNYKQF